MAITSSSWMAALADQTPMTAVAIPGTHDTCCYDLNGVEEQLEKSKWKPLFNTAKTLLPGKAISAVDYVVQVIALTQNLSIRQQLDAGVRFFDLRPSFGGGITLPIYHGIVRTKITLVDVMDEVTKFLNENKSEYVVLRIKAENDSVSQSKRAELLQNCLAPYKNHLFQRPESGLTAVSAARGRVVLITQDIGALNAPFYAESWGSASIQDDYEINAEENFISTIAEGVCNIGTKPIKALLGYFGKKTGNWCDGIGKQVPKIFVPDKVFDTKRLAIKNHHLKSIARSSSDLSRFSINFVSCVGSGSDVLFLSPQVCAGKFNPGIKDLIAKNSNGDKSGIVVMDFITEELAKGIYLSNKLAA